jgi:DNA segregation ATPase FtsK/SpoIIIE, S-DNA-T family
VFSHEETFMASPRRHTPQKRRALRGCRMARIGLRRSMRRIAQMTGAALLWGAAVFLALALASYTQTDPSPSTAAAGETIANWMGATGAFMADRVLLIFGLPAVLLLPLLYVSARKLWRGYEHEDEPETTAGGCRPALLMIAMALLATVLSLTFEGPGEHPARAGRRLSGLLGAGDRGGRGALWRAGRKVGDPRRLRSPASPQASPC